MWKTWSPKAQGFLRSVNLCRVNRSLRNPRKGLTRRVHKRDEVALATKPRGYGLFLDFRNLLYWLRVLYPRRSRLDGISSHLRPKKLPYFDYSLKEPTTGRRLHSFFSFVGGCECTKYNIFYWLGKQAISVFLLKLFLQPFVAHPDFWPRWFFFVVYVIGSNCINVFVGIGVPWLLQTFYNLIWLREEFRVPAAGLSFSLLLFFVTFILCHVVVVARRFIFGGELGGPRKWAWASSIYFLSLWLIFVVLSCLRAYRRL